MVDVYDFDLRDINRFFRSVWYIMSRKHGHARGCRAKHVRCFGMSTLQYFDMSKISIRFSTLLCLLHCNVVSLSWFCDQRLCLSRRKHRHGHWCAGCRLVEKRFNVKTTHTLLTMLLRHTSVWYSSLRCRSDPIGLWYSSLHCIADPPIPTSCGSLGGFAGCGRPFSAEMFRNSNRYVGLPSQRCRLSV